MKFTVGCLFAATVLRLFAEAPAKPNAGAAYGPAAAMAFARHYQGDAYIPGVLHCYPDAKGIPFSETVNIIPMAAGLWTPAQLVRDFKRRMTGLPENERKKGLIVLLKTERCATKPGRFCSITTAALEKRSTPLVAEFLVYGVWLKPRDHDDPPGSLKIETGKDSWKNDAAGEYTFAQGPGATLVFIDPYDSSVVDRTDAMKLNLFMEPFVASGGTTPQLHSELKEILGKLKS